MSTPTPDEIAAAIATLRAVPGVSDVHSLGGIAQIASPVEQLARELLGRWTEDPPYADRAAAELADIAAGHRLRITTNPEPGELIEYRLVRRCANGWILHDHTTSYTPDPGGVDAARADRDKFASGHTRNPQVVAVYLLPEGGKA